jgi:N-acetylmuramidase
MNFFKDHARLAKARLALKRKGPHEQLHQETVAASLQTYRRVGGLIEDLARACGIKSKAALAVWLVESGGYSFLRGKPVLRFEVHKLWQHWGSQNAVEFEQHFQFGGHNGVEGKSWQNHQWRGTVSDAWRKVHAGSQESEYEVFKLATRLAGRENACLSASFGGPQILGSNHAVIGYGSAAALFEAFAKSERWQVLGFFDFVQAKELLGALAAEDWLAFARVYNGEGNATVYADRIKQAYDSL